MMLKCSCFGVSFWVKHMNYKEKLFTAIIKGIYKNIILDAELEHGEIVSCFCPEADFNNMLYAKEAKVYLSRSKDARKYVPYICQMVDKGDGLVFVNYKYKNDLFLEAFKNGILQEDLGAYTKIRRIEDNDELQRVNFELSDDDGNKAYVYVVNIYNKQGANVVFPSFINFFEIEMYEEMKNLRKNKHETIVMLIVPREDCNDAQFVWGHDPIAAAKIYDEVNNGLRFCCYGCNVNEKSVSIARKMKILY